MSSEKIIVKGFLVMSRLPSKSLLDTHLAEIYKGEKIGRKEIKLVIGYFYNKLGSLSRKFYNDILVKYAVDAGFGYIVPLNRVHEFLRAVDELKSEYERYESQLKEFLLYGKIPEDLSEYTKKRAKIDVNYVKLVKEYLIQQGVLEEDWRIRVENINIKDRVRVNLIPFILDYDVIKEYIDREARERVEREIEVVKNEIVSSLRRHVAEKAREIIERIKKLAEREIRRDILDKIKTEVLELNSKISEFGVKIEELEVLRDMLNEEKLREIVVEATSGRLRALLEW